MQCLCVGVAGKGRAGRGHTSLEVRGGVRQVEGRSWGGGTGREERTGAEHGVGERAGGFHWRDSAG